MSDTVTVTIASLKDAIIADRVRRYIARGRPLAAMTEEQIRAHWQAAPADAEGEFLLRGLPLPSPIFGEGGDDMKAEVNLATVPQFVRDILIAAAQAGRLQ